MIISFKYKPQKNALTINNVFDVKIEKNEDNRILSFPQDGMDMEFNDKEKTYKVYFDIDMKLKEERVSTNIINEIRKLYLRKKKIECLKKN